MRVSDTERQRTIDELRRHCAAGRIDVDEYSVRLERAFGATTLEELDHLTTDLPMLRIADPAGYRSSNGRAGSGGDTGRTHALSAGEWASGFAPATGLAGRLTATAVVMLTVVVVVTAIVLALAVSWGWATALIVGWLIGVLQSRIARRLKH